MVQPCLTPSPGQRRIDIITRLRTDARLYHPVGPRPRAKGRRRQWGGRMAAPQHHWTWTSSWQHGRAWIYGRMRAFRDKQIPCRWAVSGPDTPGHVLVIEVHGDQEPWFLVTTALDLRAAHVVEVFAARFPQEDGFRDHTQRLGMEECRAWTKEPVWRTFQVQMVTLTRLRLLQRHLDQAWGVGGWWFKPEWNPHKRHPSILDLRRLFWQCRTACSQFLVTVETVQKSPQALASRATRDTHAA